MAGFSRTMVLVNSQRSPKNSHTSTMSATSSRRAKDLFGDCALVEIIHLHDCFRGALRALELDVTELCKEISTDSYDGDATSSSSSTARPSSAVAARPASIEGTKYSDKIIDLERRVAGRFTVIWSVFRAHSAAEDEFIWPALKAKQISLPASPCHSPRGAGSNNNGGNVEDVQILHQQQPSAAGVEDDEEAPPQQRERQNSIVHHIEQEEYEEDHADEERMFNSINELLSTLRVELQKGMTHDNSLEQAADMLLDGTKKLMQHLLTHLDKEETHCMPLVAQYLTKHEINDLVGKIMVSFLWT